MREATLFQTPSSLICAVICATAALFPACNQPFDPRGPLDNKLVVFSVLSGDRDVQFVRVERTYEPSSFDASAYRTDNFVPAASVTIRDSDSTYTLRDTSFARSDTSRYKFALRAYSVRPLKVNYGARYQLTVRSPQFEDVSTSIVVPLKPTMVMALLTTEVLQNPGSFQDSAEIIFTIDLGAGSKGWIGRFYVCYKVLKGAEWIEERAEVPVYFIFPDVFGQVTYAHLTHAGYLNRSAAVYLNTHYRKTLVQIGYEKYPNSKVTFTRALFQLVQVEENLYSYYRVVHAYSDPQSVRLDEPMYSNLVAGVGVVGAYTLDSLVQTLPPNFVGNRQ